MSPRLFKLLIIGVCAIVLLELAALRVGLNGVAFTGSVAGIGAVIGYAFKTVKIQKGQKDG